jgi:hypothetical protein
MVGALLTLIVALTIGMVAGPLTTGAQPSAKLPRIRLLQPGTSASAPHLLEAFKLGMRERWYVEGKDGVCEPRPQPSWSGI